MAKKPIEFITEPNTAPIPSIGQMTTQQDPGGVSETAQRVADNQREQTKWDKTLSSQFLDNLGYVAPSLITENTTHAAPESLVKTTFKMAPERLAEVIHVYDIPPEYHERLAALEDTSRIMTEVQQIRRRMEAQQFMAGAAGGTAATIAGTLLTPENALSIGAVSKVSALSRLAAEAGAIKAAGTIKTARRVGIATEAAVEGAANMALGEATRRQTLQETNFSDLAIDFGTAAILQAAASSHSLAVSQKAQKALKEQITNKLESEGLKLNDGHDAHVLNEHVSTGDDVFTPKMDPVNDPNVLNVGKAPQPDVPKELSPAVREIIEGPAPKVELPVKTIEAPKAAEAPKVEPQADPVSPDVPKEIQVPEQLLKARPRYVKDGVQLTPKFESNIDKALYIVGQTKRSAHDEAYMQFLRESMPGKTDEALRDAGRAMKTEHVRAKAAKAVDEQDLKSGAAVELPVAKANEQGLEGHTNSPNVPLGEQQLLVQDALDQRVKAIGDRLHDSSADYRHLNALLADAKPSSEEIAKIEELYKAASDARSAMHKASPSERVNSVEELQRIRTDLGLAINQVLTRHPNQALVKSLADETASYKYQLARWEERLNVSVKPTGTTEGPLWTVKAGEGMSKGRFYVEVWDHNSGRRFETASSVEDAETLIKHALKDYPKPHPPGLRDVQEAVNGILKAKALGVLAATGLGVYSIGSANAAEGQGAGTTAMEALAGLGSIAIIGMTKGNSSVMKALGKATKLEDAVKLPEVKANPEDVVLHTQDGQKLKLVDMVQRNKDNATPGFSIKVNGKVINDPTALIGEEARNGYSKTGTAFASHLLSVISGNSTKGALNATTSDVFINKLTGASVENVQRSYTEAVAAFAKEQGGFLPGPGRPYDGRLLKEFNAEIRKAKLGDPTASEHAKRVAATLAKEEANTLALAADVRQMLHEKGQLVEGSPIDIAGQLLADKHYISRQFDRNGFFLLRGKIGDEGIKRLFVGAIQSKNPHVDLSKAEQLASNVHKTWLSLMEGTTAHASSVDSTIIRARLKEAGDMDEAAIDDIMEIVAPVIKKEKVPGQLKRRMEFDDTYTTTVQGLDGNPIEVSIAEIFQQDALKLFAGWSRTVNGIIGMGYKGLDLGIDLSDSKTVDKLMDQIRQEAYANAPTPEAAEKYVSLLDASYKHLTGRGGQDIFKASSKYVAAANDLTTLELCSKFVFSAVPELVRTVFERGFLSFIKDSGELTQFVLAAKRGDIPEGLARELIAANGLGTHQTQATLDALEAGGISTIGQHIKTAVGQAFFVSGFNAVTMATRYSSMKGALQKVIDASHGTRQLSKGEWDLMALRGMNEEMVRTMGPLIMKHAKVDAQGILTDFDMAALRKENFQAGLELEGHLFRVGEASGNTPAGIGETHRFAHNDAGRVAMKFMGTPLLMTHKLKGEMNNINRTVVGGWLASLSGAAAAYVARTYLDYRNDPEKLDEKLTTSAIARAAVRNSSFGLLPNVIDTARLTAGFTPVFDSTTSGRTNGQVPIMAVLEKNQARAKMLVDTVKGNTVTQSQARKALTSPWLPFNALLPDIVDDYPVKKPRSETKQDN